MKNKLKNMTVGLTRQSAEVKADPAWARARRKLIWGSWAVLVILLAAISLLYAISLRDQLTRSAWNEAQAATRMLQWRMQGQIQHLDDVLLHTCESFERLGVSLTEKDALFKGRQQGAGSPYEHLFILGPQGESMLSLPAKNMPWTADVLLQQARQHGMGDIFTLSNTSTTGAALARVLPVWDAQGQFQGVVAGVLPTSSWTEWVNTTAETYGLDLSLTHGQKALYNYPEKHDPLEIATDWREQVSLKDVGLVIDMSLRSAPLNARWSTAWELLLFMLIATLMAMTAGAMWLSRILTRQVIAATQLRTERESAHLRARFLANMSHELRTPLMGVLGATELLEQTSSPNEQQRYVQMIQNSGQHLLGLLNNVLDFSRLEANALPLDAQPTSPLKVLEDIAQTFTPQVQLGQVDFYCTLDLPPLLQIKLDGFRLGQVVSNLLGNAFKFTQQGWVRLHAEIQSQDEHTLLKLKITDTGIGISESAQQTLFQPFQQADASSSRRYGGTGLGLVIVKQLVELMNGQLAMRSTEGLGTEIEITLPVEVIQHAPEPRLHPTSWHLSIKDDLLRVSVCTHLRLLGVPFCTETLSQGDFSVQVCDESTWLQEQSTPNDICRIRVGSLKLSQGSMDTFDSLTIHEPARHATWALTVERCLQRSKPAKSDPSTELASTSEHPVRVLVAEDNLLTSEILKQFLKDANIPADFASNGAIAMDYWHKNKYDLVILDCHMPVMDGFEVARTIRSEEPLGVRQALIALTAATFDEDITSCLQSGMDAVWPKPVSRQTFIQNIMDLLPEPKILEQDEVEIAAHSEHKKLVKFEVHA
jgi:signal transduction histidine kinase/FixJ family two-component response regulator